MCTVLYIDDEPALLDLGKLFLKKFGIFSVETGLSAREGLSLLKERSIDCVVSDYQMPEMDGLEFLKTLRDEKNPVPFILFTGRGREEVVIKALNEGADFYLQKGGDPTAQYTELAHKIRLAVKQRNSIHALEESEHRYRDLVETQTEFICRYKPDGTHVFANEAYCRHFRKQRDQVTGHRFIPSIPDEDQEMVNRHFSELIPENPSAEIEHRVVMPDGSIRWHWWRNHAIFDNTDRVVEYQSVGKDITDRKHAEEALHKSENLYRALFDYTLAATSIIDQDMKILKVNAAWERLCGYPKEEAENRMNWTEFIHRDDLERLKQYHIVRRTDPISTPQIYECRVLDREGSVHSCITYVDMIPETKNSIVSLVDITDRKNAEEAIRENEEKFRLFIDHAPAALAMFDREMRYIAASRRWITDFHLEGEEIIGRSHYEVFPDIPDSIKEVHQRGIAGEIVSAKEDRFDRAGGTVEWLNWEMLPWHTANHAIGGIIIFTENISEQKKAEELIRESEEKYRTILENIQECYYRTDTENKIILASSSCTDILGYASPEDLYGRDIAQTLYVNPDDRKHLLTGIDQNGFVRNFEILLKKKTGRRL